MDVYLAAVGALMDARSLEPPEAGQWVSADELKNPDPFSFTGYPAVVRHCFGEIGHLSAIQREPFFVVS